MLAYKPPTVYKGATPVGMDSTFVMEKMAEVVCSMTRFLDASTTPAERLYYETVFVMATLIPTCAGTDRSAVADTLAYAAAGVTTGLETLRFWFAESTLAPVATFRRLHDLTMLHDTAVAVKLAVGWILAFNEREKERDRSGRNGFPKNVVTLLKGLQSDAEGTLIAGKGVLKALGGLDVSNIRKWALDTALGEVIEDGTIKELVESWRLNAKGWQRVTW